MASRKIKINGRLNLKSIKPVIEILAQEYINWKKSQQTKKLQKSANNLQILQTRGVAV